MNTSLNYLWEEKLKKKIFVCSLHGLYVCSLGYLPDLSSTKALTSSKSKLQRLRDQSEFTLLCDSRSERNCLYSWQKDHATIRQCSGWLEARHFKRQKWERKYAQGTNWTVELQPALQLVRQTPRGNAQNGKQYMHMEILKSAGILFFINCTRRKIPYNFLLMNVHIHSLAASGQ